MNLTTRYLGLNLRSPLVVGAAAPLTEDLHHIRHMEDAGAAAIVLHSLFEEQIRYDQLEHYHHSEHGAESFAEALSYFPEPHIFSVGPEAYLYHIQRAKASVEIPIIASLNGSTAGGWIDYARQIEQAGADALELNIYFIPTDLDLPGASVEQRYIDILRTVKAAVTIPVAVKLSPYFSNMAYMANRLAQTGANGLVLFNRFYQPDINITDLEVYPHILLSTSYDMRLPMRWIAILHGRIDSDLAASGGIQSAYDVIRMLMVGAQATLMVGALLRYGIDYLREVERDLQVWMQDNGYASVQEIQGIMSQLRCPNPSEFERVHYMKAIQTQHSTWADAYEISHFFG